ncbi:MAG: hypothetical protein S4CHLAM20_14740 [Chlamydiia bacterium]|nr:hypothetical protein [Chlamydiia bacterium]
MEVQPCTLFLIVQKLRHILSLKDFRQMVMMVICPLLLKDTQFKVKTRRKKGRIRFNCKNSINVNLIHAPIYQFVATISHHEKIRYNTRLYITIRFNSPSHLDIWKELSRLREEDQKEKKL